MKKVTAKQINELLENTVDGYVLVKYSKSYSKGYQLNKDCGNPALDKYGLVKYQAPNLIEMLTIIENMKLYCHLEDSPNHG